MLLPNFLQDNNSLTILPYTSSETIANLTISFTPLPYIYCIITHIFLHLWWLYLLRQLILTIHFLKISNPIKFKSLNVTELITFSFTKEFSGFYESIIDIKLNWLHKYYTFILVKFSLSHVLWLILFFGSVSFYYRRSNF